ncbi:uncharacterized protein LOC120259964 [Dioscorea cayenensis subsp. rotundata]|uniref:Uncharacterized protein LOC120259964 n=1 Tax=Dioscorea cayennensis subsp. rotundata TaxID=55577 RepID=A0AB40B850_DIOCR|nr:uncharacterized protein LOC120259964 [Dioscorea cayenensis subsp. rotundata]
MASYNDQVNKVVLEHAPKSAKYVSHLIQKEILHILANKVWNKIREDIRESKFYIIVNEAHDESKKEQMALILRFVDESGIIRECFFDISDVKDTSALALKNNICSILSRHTFGVQNIRGQGYDGASNMRGEWKGLQALFLNDYPSAYYVQCLAHRLQLALVVASREVHSIHEFFNNLSFIINSVDALCKCCEELQIAQATKIASMLTSDEVVTGKDLSSQFGERRRQHQQSQIMIEHHYHFDIFNEVIDFQLQKLNSRLNVQAMDLLTLSRIRGKFSATTSERVFSAMKIIKTRLRNKIEYGFLVDNLVVNIKREIVETFSSYSKLEDFVMLKEWHSQF